MAPRKKPAPRKRAPRKTAPPLGVPREVEPNAALVEEIHRTAGHIAKLGEIVDALPAEQLVEGVTRTVRGPDGEETVTTETAPNIWLRLYQQERKHLLDVSKTAHGCGVTMALPEGEADAVNDIEAQRAKRLAGVSRTAN